MELDRVDIKVFVSNPESVRWSDFTEIFTRWRDEDSERWLDIADYLHMPHGPGLLLVGTDVHVSMDNRHGRPGLLYSRRLPLSGSTRERIVAALRETLEFAAKMEGESSLSLRFGTDALDFVVNDRVQFPNDVDGFTALRGDLSDALSEVWGGAHVALSRNSAATERLTVHVTVDERRAVGAILDDFGIRV